MIAMEQEGSTDGFLRKKCIPFITGFELVAGLFTFSAGVAVIHREKAHAAISSVNIQTAPILLLVAGIFSLSLACLGVSFIKKKMTFDGIGKAVIIVFTVILALRALFALIAGGVGIDCIKKVKDKFEENLQNGLENYGRTGYETMANIDRLQKQDECCGVFTYADWRATIYGGHRYDKVPDSCCKTEEYACGFKFKDEATLNKMGCASIALDKMDQHLRIVGASGIAFGITEVILLIVILISLLSNRCTQDQAIADVKVEYQKADDDSGGGDESGAQAGSTPSTQGHDVLSPQGGRAGAKATLPPLKAKTAPESLEETRTEKQETKQGEKSNQGKG